MINQDTQHIIEQNDYGYKVTRNSNNCNEFWKEISQKNKSLVKQLTEHCQNLFRQKCRSLIFFLYLCTAKKTDLVNKVINLIITV